MVHLLSASETKAWEDGMRARSGSLCTPTGKWRSSAWAVAIGAAALLLGNTAWAQNSPALRLIKIIPIKVTPFNSAKGMFSFDISFVDPKTGLYYLGDRSNAAVDVIDTKTDTLFGQIGANPSFSPGFAGDTGNANTSGPNGVAAASPCIFVTDTPSRVVSFNSSVSFTADISSFNTGGGNLRADELAFDPKDRLLLVINNANDPPFGTLINVSTSCVLSRPKTIFFTAANGVDATNGAEQPVWDPNTQRFYVSIPQIGSNVQNGGVIRINPNGGAIEAVYPVNFMQPAGLTLGPNGDLLVGANSVFDASGGRCTTVLPAETGEGTATEAEPHPATCTGIAAPQSAICNPGRGCTPANGSLVAVPGVGGGDEVWFNAGDGNYYVTAGNLPLGPVFGVIESKVNTLNQLVPTLPPVPAVTTGANKHGQGTVHSVAACSALPNGPCSTNKVYVPLPANTAYSDPSGNNCVQGCVAVFSAE
jgi:hypothetical protein